MGELVLNGSKITVSFQTNLSLFDKLSYTKRTAVDIKQIILHHDVCGSAARCFSALKSQDLSTHFCVDNDGVVWQFLDPAVHRAIHAAGYVATGNGRERLGFNAHSIGIDISNLVLLKYRGRYNPPRPEATISIHDRAVTGMLPYPVQIENTLKLLKVLVDHFGISTQHSTATGWSGIITPTTPGIYGHAQINPGKIDPFGFPFERLAELTNDSEKS